MSTAVIFIIYKYLYAQERVKYEWEGHRGIKHTKHPKIHLSLKPLFMEWYTRRTGAGSLLDLGVGGVLLVSLALTWMYKYPEACTEVCRKLLKEEKKKNTLYNELQFAACTRFSAGSEGIYWELSHHIINRDTATHLQFSVLFNFYILLIWLLLLMKTSVYIRVLLVKRTRRRTDGKTFVNIIVRQRSRFSG